MFQLGGSIQARLARVLAISCGTIAIFSAISLYSLITVRQSLVRQSRTSTEKLRRLDHIKSQLSSSTALAKLARGVIGEVEGEIVRIEDSATDVEAERQHSIEQLDRLWDVNLLVTLLTLVLPAISLFVLGRTVNGELSSFTESLNDFSLQNDESSESMRAAAQNLSSASAEQSAAVQESVASIAEIRSMLAQTSNHVREVQMLTTAVNDKTHGGSQTMTKMEAAMGQIEQANQQLVNFAQIIQSIREKTHVINDIVFKTQLLSFNASIEAARAGQYGRGFAVVAEEVGKLAQLSGGASKDIDQLLSDSHQRVTQIVNSVKDRVGEGKDVSHEALKRFGEIANQISIIADKVNQVGEATQEQESGVEQTARAMDQMDATAAEAKRAADQIHKIAEEVRTSSGRVRETASAMRRYVSRRTSDRAPSLAAPPRARARHRDDGGKMVDLVQRIARKTSADVNAFSADDPSFRKTGEG